MTNENQRYSRQSFLGSMVQKKIETTSIGIVGLGGGGSHVVQQLALIGFQRYTISDPDIVDHSNLNRLIGVNPNDAERQTPKATVARRVIRGLQKQSQITAHRAKWQDCVLSLRTCDILFGCIDGFAARRELEIFARRYLIPLIDIGMDVHAIGSGEFSMSGQVIISMPGRACLQCVGFLTEQKFSQEASKYGAAGDRPQVVWANGVLASQAVGIAIDLLTDWTKSLRSMRYLAYDGNTGAVIPHPRLSFCDEKKCPHFNSNNIGDPVLKTV